MEAICSRKRSISAKSEIDREYRSDRCQSKNAWGLKTPCVFCQENWRMAFEWRKIDASVIPLLSRILTRGGGKTVAFRVHIEPAFKALVLHACGAQRFVQIQVMLRRVNDAAGNIGAMV